jgi:hypothetical protein
MKDYKLALSYTDGETDAPTHPVVVAPSFEDLDEFYIWCGQNTIRESCINSYTKRQMEILDVIESDVIDFLYELRVEHNVALNITEFLDKVILPNISCPKNDEIDDEEESGIFDE